MNLKKALIKIGNKNEDLREVTQAVVAHLNKGKAKKSFKGMDIQAIVDVTKKAFEASKNQATDWSKDRVIFDALGKAENWCQRNGENALEKEIKAISKDREEISKAIKKHADKLDKLNWKLMKKV